MTIVSSAPLSTGFRLPQTVVEVKFSNRASKWQGDSDSVYSFNSDLKDLNVGDLVVCDCSTGYTIGSVVSIAQIDTSGRTSRWLVQKLDLTRHSERLALAKKQKELRGLMDLRRKQLEDEALYRMMAERDPEMAKLIAEYYGV